VGAGELSVASKPQPLYDAERRKLSETFVMLAIANRYLRIKTVSRTGIRIKAEKRHTASWPDGCRIHMESSLQQGVMGLRKLRKQSQRSVHDDLEVETRVCCPLFRCSALSICSRPIDSVWTR
jgi:hypothetical protein